MGGWDGLLRMAIQKREDRSMIINCHDYEWFMDVCYDLLQRGVKFEADTETLKVTLTGGY